MRVKLSVEDTERVYWALEDSIRKPITIEFDDDDHSITYIEVEEEGEFDIEKMQFKSSKWYKG